MEIEEISRKIMNCSKCPLSKTRRNPVAGYGDSHSKIMFIGEAPGANEDILGKPFVGQSGKVFDKLLKSIGTSREKVYITNLVKCRPPNNRKPTRDEISACSTYLNGEIDAIRPRLICPLGSFATEFILSKYGMKKESISRIHGKRFVANTLFGNVTIIPLFHPAVAVYNQNRYSELEQDFAQLAKYII